MCGRGCGSGSSCWAEGECRTGRACGAAAVVVDRLVVGLGGGVFVGRVGGEREVAAGAGAGIGEAGGEELLEGGEVEGQAVGLAELGVPGEAEPEEVFAHGGGELGARALGIDVFVAEVERAVGGAGALVGDEEGAGVAEVEKAGGRGSEAAGVGRSAGAFGVAGLRRREGVFVNDGSNLLAGLRMKGCTSGVCRRRCWGGGGSRSSA